MVTRKLADAPICMGPSPSGALLAMKPSSGVKRNNATAHPGTFNFSRKLTSKNNFRRRKHSAQKIRCKQQRMDQYRTNFRRREFYLGWNLSAFAMHNASKGRKYRLDVSNLNIFLTCFIFRMPSWTLECNLASVRCFIFM